MKGLFCSYSASSDEEYKKLIKMRMRFFIGLFILGLITCAITLMAEFVWSVTFDDYMLGVYLGVAIGLMIMSPVLWVRNKRLLNNDEKRKHMRIATNDERVQSISKKAFRAAACVLLAAMYAGGLIGGIFYPILAKVLLFSVCIFLVAYSVAYIIIQKKM